MAKKTEKSTKLVKGGIIFSTINEENPFYKSNPQEMKLAQYLTSAGKNSISMKNEGNSFPFTDYVVNEINEVDEGGEIIKTEKFIVAYDVVSHTCYYTMSRGLAKEFDEFIKNNIIPSADGCQWIVKATEQQFKDDDGKTLRTYNLDIVGIEKILHDTESTSKVEALPEGETESKVADVIVD